MRIQFDSIDELLMFCEHVYPGKPLLVTNATPLEEREQAYNAGRASVSMQMKRDMYEAGREAEREDAARRSWLEGCDLKQFCNAQGQVAGVNWGCTLPMDHPEKRHAAVGCTTPEGDAVVWVDRSTDEEAES